MARTIYAGVHEDAAPTATIGRFPAAKVGREFVPGKLAPGDIRPQLDKLSKPWLDAGGRVYLSFKPQPADVAAGYWTAHLRKTGAWLADRPGAALIVWHEPEDDLDGNAYARMFNQVRAEIKAGWAGARVVYCAMTYQWRPGGLAAKNPAGWRSANADEYLADVYSGKSFPASAILPQHTGFTGWYNAIVQPRLAAGEAVQWGLGERGFQSPDAAVRVDAIKREAAWLAAMRGDYARTGQLGSYPPSLYLAWSTPGTEKDPRWILDGPAADEMNKLVAAFAA
jgi:hypothetical protein